MMIDREKLTAELDNSTEELLHHFNQYEDDQFNSRPSPNAWSPAEVAEHILLLETAVNKALHDAVDTNRPVDLKIAPVKTGLENLEKKFVAPGFIHPSSNTKEKSELITAIKTQREILSGIIEKTDLSQTPTYRHPVIGDMTRLEWIYFVIHHSQRHLRQLQVAS